MELKDTIILVTNIRKMLYKRLEKEGVDAWEKYWMLET